MFDRELKTIILPRLGYQDNGLVYDLVVFWDSLILKLTRLLDDWSFFNSDLNLVRDDELEFLLWLSGLKALGIYHSQWSKRTKYKLLLDSLGFILPNRGELVVLERCLDTTIREFNPQIFFDGGFYAEISLVDSDSIGSPGFDVAVLLDISSFNNSLCWETANILCRALIPAPTSWLACLDHFYCGYSRVGDLILD